MLIALTGTPGTGKTSVALALQTQGITTISLNQLAISHKFFDGIDSNRGSYILDLDEINRYITQNVPFHTEPVVIEGHAAHWLTMAEWIIILRCHPQILRKRLKTKKWGQQKIKENIEAEALDIILCEATEIHHPDKLLEFNTTKQSIDQVAKKIYNIINHNFADITKYCIGKIDWSDELLKNTDD